jgi:hypothetical protein
VFLLDFEGEEAGREGGREGGRGRERRNKSESKRKRTKRTKDRVVSFASTTSSMYLMSFIVLGVSC